MNCQEVDRLLTPYVDGEASATEGDRVAAHLAGCPTCAGRVAAEQAARRVVHLRARMLCRPAPPPLRARCAGLARPATVRAPIGWFSWPAARLAGAMTVVALVVGLVGYALLGHSPLVLAAGLTLDHLKCFSLSEAAAGPPDAPALQARLEREYGWRVRVPPGESRDGLRLVGARRCFSIDGSVAHVLYRHAGQPLSLFMLPNRVWGASRLSLVGHAARIWSRGATTYVLIGSESDAGLPSIVKYFQSTSN